MISIDPNALYSRAEADELLRGVGISLEALLDNLGVRPRFKHVVAGIEILTALRRAAEAEPPRRPEPTASVALGAKKRQKHVCANASLAPLTPADIEAYSRGARHETP